MAVIEPEALNPHFTTPYTTISGAQASTVRTEIDTKISGQNAMANLSMGALEQVCQVMGNGHLSGGTIAAGVGLSVDIAAWTAIVGTPIGNDASTTVGGLEPNEVNYIFARQDGSFTVNQDGSDPPTTLYGDFLLWGTATTDAGSVTAVSNSRKTFAKGIFRSAMMSFEDAIEQAQAGYVAEFQHRTVIAHADILTLPTTPVEILPTYTGDVMVSVVQAIAISNIVAAYTNGGTMTEVVTGWDDVNHDATVPFDVSPGGIWTLLDDSGFCTVPGSVLYTDGGTFVNASNGNLPLSGVQNTNLALSINNGAGGNLTGGNAGNTLTITVIGIAIPI